MTYGSVLSLFVTIFVVLSCKFSYVLIVRLVVTACLYLGGSFVVVVIILRVENVCGPEGA